MAWSDFKRSAVRAWQNASEAAARQAHLGRNNARIKDLELRDGKLVYAFSKFLVKDCTVELVQGSERQRMTATRTTLAGLAAGPMGGVLAMLSKKDVSKAWIFVETPKGEWKITLGPKHRDDAVLFLRSYAREYEAQLDGDVPS